LNEAEGEREREEKRRERERQRESTYALRMDNTTFSQVPLRLSEESKKKKE